MSRQVVQKKYIHTIVLTMAAIDTSNTNELFFASSHIYIYQHTKYSFTQNSHTVKTIN